MCPHKTVDRTTLFVVQRENDAGQRGMLAVQETVRCEVNDPVLIQFRVEYSFPASSEIECLQAARFSGFGGNGVRLSSAERQSGKIEQADLAGRAHQFTLRRRSSISRRRVCVATGLCKARIIALEYRVCEHCKGFCRTLTIRSLPPQRAKN